MCRLRLKKLLPQSVKTCGELLKKILSIAHTVARLIDPIPNFAIDAVKRRAEKLDRTLSFPFFFLLYYIEK